MRASSREAALPPSTCANRPRISLSGSVVGGTFQVRTMRGCGTRSYITSRRASSRAAMLTAWRVSGGPAGMWPKYFCTFSFAVATSMSPASTRVALAAP